jgi:Rrf2 family protein
VLRLNKKTEYALLALRVMGLSAAAPTLEPIAATTEAAPLVTAAEIARRYRIPEMLLSKVLQRLKKAGIVEAAKGSGGGYRLARPLEAVSLAELITLFEDEVALVECQGAEQRCAQEALCDIREPLAVLGEALMEPLRAMSVRDLFERRPVTVATRPKRAPVFRILQH